MKYLSLFSGIGGFELGIQNSKHNEKLECIGFSEVDKYATSIYKKRFPEHNELGDVKKINTKELPDFDLLVGGFPCQAFSIAGKRRGFDDTRGTLFFEIARILKDKKPKYFLLENVKGLLSHDKGSTFKTILEVLSNLGYDVQWEVLNSKNYGVPQNRERIFIKGYFRGKCGGEVLSVTRKGEETDGKINSYRDKSRTYSIYSDNETLSRTLTSSGQNCVKNHIIKVGSTSPSGHHGKNVYSVNGQSPTLCSGSLYKKGVRILEEEPRLKKLNNKSQSQSIYDVSGLSCTLSANGGGEGGKTGLYDVTSYDGVEKFEGHNVVNLGDTEKATTTKNGDFFSVSTKRRDAPFKKCQYNYIIDINESMENNNIIEKVYEGTQEHCAKTDGSYSPTLTEAMGKGGGHVPLLKLKNEECLDKEYVEIQTCTKKGFDKAYVDRDGINITRPSCKTRRGRVQKDKVGTLTANDYGGWGVYNNYRVRRLTPLECERLQGFSDNWTKYGEDGELISDTQRYKCCGNAVTTNVITYIMNNWDF